MAQRKGGGPVKLAALIIVGIAFSQAAKASGTGLLPIADPIAAAKTAVGSTQVLELRSNGSVLVAQPHSLCLDQVVAYAPGLQRITLVLRERQVGEGRWMLQITAPEHQEHRIERVTLFLKSPAGGSLRMFQPGPRGWLERSTQQIAVGGTAASERHMTGVSFAELGLFLVVEDASSDATDRLPPPEFGGFDRGIRLTRASSNVLWPGVLLAALFWVSRWAHSRTP